MPFDLLVADGQDAAIADLVAGLPLATLTLPPATEPLRWLDAALADKPVGTLHLVAHGRAGALRLGGGWVDAEALRASAALLARWQVQRIALWSCDVGVRSDLVSTLSDLTGAEVLASDGPLGAVADECRWVLAGTDDGSGPLDGRQVFGHRRAEAWAHQLGLTTVSFSGGFAGDNGGTNATNYSYSFQALGWSHAQFAQDSVSGIFTAQGNDIIGFVLLTDDSGVQHTIPGFVKWRTPSGNSPSTLVFQPDGSVNLNLATDGSGAYGSSTFAINSNFYIGLVFNGQSLSMVEGDPVTGNAATSGLLSVLNDYLAAQPQLSVNDLTRSEAAGTMSFTVTLSTTSADTVTVKYDTSGGTATAGSDYTALSNGTLTFNPGETSKTVIVTLTDDAAAEGNETFNLVLRDPSFAAISDATGVGTLTDDDTAVSLVTTAASAHTTEAGGTATFTVKLSSAPSADVTVTVGSADATEGTVSPTTLTFTSANWNSAQTVTVSGVDDAQIDGAIAHSATLSTSSSDALFNGLSGSVAVTNDDNDNATLVTGSISRHTTEAGQTATFTLRLSSQPTADVTVSVASGDATEGTVNVSTLTFTAANWNTPQTVTVSGVDDAQVDGNTAFAVNLGSSSGDSHYQGLSASVTVTNDDDDSAGLVTGSISRHTNEAGQTATFTVQLSSQPTADVTVSVATGDATEGTAGVSTLTFTAANWNTPQTVTVSGVDDAQADGNTAYAVNLGSSSSDSHYQGLSASVAVTNDDNDSASLVAGAISRHTTEAGQSATFTLQLSSEPSADVSVAVASDDATEGTAGVSTLTFTAGNWQTPQTVTVTGADDAQIDGQIAYAIGLNASSSDASYQGLSGSVAVTNDDNDSATLVVGAISRHTTEAGQSATFTLRLNSQPSADVVVGVSSSDTTEGTVGASTLTFTAANWNSPQTVTVTGVDDVRIDGAISYQINLAASSADGNYQGLSGSVAVTNDDDDVPALVLGTAPRHTTEGGQTTSFSVALAAQPTASVTVSLASSDVGEGTLGVSSLTFTPANWNQAQFVTVTGVDDDGVDGAEPYLAQLLTQSADADFDGLSGAVGLVNDDDDSASLRLSTVNLRTSEDGGYTPLGVALASRPTADVIVSVLSSDASEGVAGPFTLTFTPANWSQPQEVRVHGIDDNRVDGDRPYFVMLEAASADGHFSGASGAVAVVNADNDRARLAVSAGRLNTGEDGRSDAFSVQLTSEPSGTVTVDVSSSVPGEARPLVTTLSFDAGNWNQAQSVRLQGVDDTRADGAQPFIVDLLAHSADPAYQGQTASVSGINADDDAVGLVLSATALHTREDGRSDSFTVHLASAPTAAVTLNLSTGLASEGRLDQRSLVFTPDDWQTPRSVTVSGVDDTLVDGTVHHAVQLTTVSSDLLYDGLAQRVSVDNEDNDRASLVLEHRELHTAEDGRGDSVGLRLSDRPAQAVTVRVSNGDAGEGLVLTPTLVFTPDNWDQAQPVRVQGLDDPAVDGEQAYRIDLVSQSNDPAFAGLTSQLDVRNADDDLAGLQVLAGVDLQTSEDGTAAHFTLRLTSRPLAPVTVNLHSSDGSEGLPAEQQLLFTPEDWDQPRNVVVNGVDDQLVDGLVPYALWLNAQSADPAYDGRSAQVSLRNVDNDLASGDTHPGFGVDGDVQPGDTARLLDPAGEVVASTVLTVDQVQQGTVVITPPALDDGTYTFMAQVLDAEGELRSERPVTVTIVTDRDGVSPSVEQAAHGGDVNHDGLLDWQQPNVTQLPLRSPAEFQAGARAAPASFGAVLAGAPAGDGPVLLDPQAQLQDVLLQGPGAAVPAGLQGGAPVLRLTLTSQAGQTWQDADGTLAGHQGEVTVELPFGLDTNTVLLWDGAGNRWLPVLGRGFSAPDNLVRLQDLDHDGRPDRMILRVTDGGAGDGDGSANGSLQLAITVAQQAATPVLSVRLPDGDRLLTQDPAQAALWARGEGNVLEGAWFDALTPAEGGVAFKAWAQPITQDHTWAADGQALPYACYEPEATAGFLAALPDSGVGQAVHLYLDGSGRTQLFTPASAAALDLAAQGYRDLGIQLRSTTESAFRFDPEGYLVANRDQAVVQDLVAALSQRFTSTTAPGFVEAVEQHYLAEVQLLGLPHGDSADEADVNAAFGTRFGG